MIYLLDANALIRYIAVSRLMSQSTRDIIATLGNGDRLAISIIALVEAGDLSRKRRRDYVPFADVLQAVTSLNIMVVDLTMPIIHLLPDEWTDSHDMIILATALYLQERHGDVTIISSDRNMRYNQDLVPCIW